jgi:hypothetical protein
MSDRLRECNDPVKSAAEAKLVCAALDKALSATPIEKFTTASYNLSTAISLFQHAEDESAIAFLREHGLPRLRSMIRGDAVKRIADAGMVLFVAKILALYGTPGDYRLIVQIARDPQYETEYLWSSVFNAIVERGTDVAALLEGLRNPLPAASCGIAFLDFCNRASMDGKIVSHPFDSEEGRARLHEWLSQSDKSTFDYAISATAALPFVSADKARQLVEIAARHPDARVRLESAWAIAKIGEPDGLEQLADFASNPVHAHTAIRYLEELGHPGRVPEAARSPEARALAEMAHWLAHPNELGEPPESVAIADARELYWPPTNDRRRLWVIRFAHMSDGQPVEDYGLVGSITWAMFGDSRPQHPMEVYALHCCWELQTNDDPRAPSERSVAAGRRILGDYNPEMQLRSV